MSTRSARRYIDLAEMLSVLLLGVLTCLLWSWMAWRKDQQCHIVAAAIGMPAQWSISTGCMVQPRRGQWTPLPSQRQRAQQTGPGKA